MFQHERDLKCYCDGLFFCRRSIIIQTCDLNSARLSVSAVWRWSEENGVRSIYLCHIIESAVHEGQDVTWILSHWHFGFDVSGSSAGLWTSSLDVESVFNRIFSLPDYIFSRPVVALKDSRCSSSLWMDFGPSICRNGAESSRFWTDSVSVDHVMLLSYV